jgi:Family of unknown function (DUF6166)
VRMYFARNGYLTGARSGSATQIGSVSSSTTLLHSPNRHAWGYRGSAPSELAKDILCDLLGKRPATVLYQALMEDFPVGLNGTMDSRLKISRSVGGSPRGSRHHDRAGDRSILPEHGVARDG